MRSSRRSVRAEWVTSIERATCASIALLPSKCSRQRSRATRSFAAGSTVKPARSRPSRIPISARCTTLAAKGTWTTSSWSTRWSDARRAAGQPPALHRGMAPPRDSSRDRSRSGPRPTRPSSRYQAGQHHRHQPRPGQGPRFRTGQAASAGVAVIAGCHLRRDQCVRRNS